MSLVFKIFLLTCSLVFSQTSLASRTLDCHTTGLVDRSNGLSGQFSVVGDHQLFENCAGGSGKVKANFLSFHNLDTPYGYDEINSIFDVESKCSKKTLAIFGVDSEFRLTGFLQLVGSKVKREGAAGKMYFHGKRTSVMCTFRPE